MSREDLTVDLVVIGAGSGGLSVASGAAQLGLKVVLFERGEMGGDCLNTGCVPSKALLAAADAAAQARDAGRLGVRLSEPEIDFPAVMAHVHAAIATIAPIDSQERFEGLGVRVVRESARFTGPRTVESDSVRVTARKLVLAAGSRATVPPIPGLADVPYLTNESIFDLNERPRRLIVLGGGPIGVELGQAFRRLGAEVVVVEADRPLGREDPEAAEVVLDRLRAEGVEFVTGKAARVDPGPVLHLGDGRTVEGSHLLVAVGRTPLLEGLNLEAAGIAYDRNGVITYRQLRTSNKAVFAVGDIAGRGQFTHLAGAHAALVVRRALFALPVNADALVVPRVTYTDPEIAAVGLSEADARKRHGNGVKVVRADFHDNDRAVAEGATEGFAKLILSPAGKPLGVTIVGRHAGDQIHLWSLALSAGLKLTALTGMIAPYPTRGEINKRLPSLHYSPALFAPRTRRLVSVLKHFA